MITIHIILAMISPAAAFTRPAQERLHGGCFTPDFPVGTGGYTSGRDSQSVTSFTFGNNMRFTGRAAEKGITLQMRAKTPGPMLKWFQNNRRNFKGLISRRDITQHAQWPSGHL